LGRTRYPYVLEQKRMETALASEFDIVVYGEPQSAKNRRRIVKMGNRTALIKSKKALIYETIFNEQCPILDDLMECDVSLRIDVWYGSRRPDLACIDYIQDLLQKRVYKNDRQVKAHMAVWNLARKDPRARIRVKAMPLTGLENNSMAYKNQDLFDEQ
jgi:hypothetical protein